MQRRQAQGGGTGAGSRGAHPEGAYRLHVARQARRGSPAIPGRPSRVFECQARGSGTQRHAGAGTAVRPSEWRQPGRAGRSTRHPPPLPVGTSECSCQVQRARLAKHKGGPFGSFARVAGHTQRAQRSHRPPLSLAPHAVHTGRPRASAGTPPTPPTPRRAARKGCVAISAFRDRRLPAVCVFCHIRGTINGMSAWPCRARRESVRVSVIL